MPDSRRAILGRIRSALGPDIASPLASAAVPRTYIRVGTLDEPARLTLFLDRLHDYDAQVVETDSADLPSAILAMLREHSLGSVIAADGLPPALLPAFAFAAERDATLEDLDRCDAIITTCTVAIASTGSIVLAHGPGEGARRFTLVPDRHLCIVRAAQVVETVPEAFDRLALLATHPLTFISGPSATADIEMTRIRGVHGPRFLHVLMVG